MKRYYLLFFSALILFYSALGGSEEAAKAQYPEGYRAWQHVKSMVIQPGHALEDPFQGIHHIYGNELAMKGLEQNSYQDGAVLVFDLLNYQESGHALTEASRKFTAVMEYNAEKFKSTGGWGFEGFAGDSKTERLTKDGGQSCYNCHASQKEQHYVFSKYRN